MREPHDPAADVALEPEQAREVARAIAEMLTTDPPAADPWWRAGADEALSGESP